MRKPFRGVLLLSIKTVKKMHMDNLFLPRNIDNHYRGQKLALWFFWVIVTIRGLQGVSLIIAGHSVVKDADGIPLETLPDAASQSIVAMFVISGGSRLVLSFLAILAFVRYRSAIPLMFALLALDQIAKELLLRFYPLYRVGEPIGPIVNLVLLILTVIGFALSIQPKRNTKS
jgi:hypothetical protein